MATLNELVCKSNETINSIIENGGEITEQLQADLNDLKNNMAVKVDGYAMFMDKLKNEIAYFKAKADEFSNVSKSLKNLDANLKERIRYAMVELKKDEVVGETYRFKLSDTAGKMEIQDMKAIPAEYKFSTIIEEVDKDKLKADLKEGKVIAGVELVKTKSLRKYVAKSK